MASRCPVFLQAVRPPEGAPPSGPGRGGRWFCRERRIGLTGAAEGKKIGRVQPAQSSDEPGDLCQWALRRTAPSRFSPALLAPRVRCQPMPSLQPALKTPFYYARTDLPAQSVDPKGPVAGTAGGLFVSLLTTCPLHSAILCSRTDAALNSNPAFRDNSAAPCAPPLPQRRHHSRWTFPRFTFASADKPPRRLLAGQLFAAEIPPRTARMNRAYPDHAADCPGLNQKLWCIDADSPLNSKSHRMVLPLSVISCSTR